MESNELQPFILNMDTADSVDEKLKKVLSTIRKHLNMDVSFISEFIDKERVFKFVDTGSTTTLINAGDSDPLEETYCKRIVDNELPHIIHDARKNAITRKLNVTDKLSIGSYMGVPIRFSTGKVYGTLCCYKVSPDETLNQRDASFLSAVAEIAGNLIEQNVEARNIHREITERIKSVLDSNKIDIHYQPIYSLHTNKISGFESLSRFFTEPYRTPDVWFAEASRVGLGEALEMMAVEKAVQGMDKFNNDVYISINTSPEHVLSGAISRVLNDIAADRVVIEITEHSPIEDYLQFREALEPLRRRGVRLAIDDAGAGYSSFQHILELEADIIKLDISLIRDIHCSPKKLLLAKALCAFAKATKCTIIAEGIETTEELNELRELGVDSVQGYLLGRPMPVNEAISHTPDIASGATKAPTPL